MVLGIKGRAPLFRQYVTIVTASHNPEAGAVGLTIVVGSKCSNTHLPAPKK